MDEAARMHVRNEIINTPETADFMAAVPIEAAHQRERWGSSHDAGKTPFDWFWLIGYLSQKAADAAVRGDSEKARHHTISTAAALANWHHTISTAAAPDDEGNICDCCNHSFLSVYRVPNDVWRKIAPKPDTLGDFEEHLGGGVLCLSCAERRARDQGCSLVFDGLNDWSEASGEAVRLLRVIVEAYDWWQVDRGSCADEVTAARAYLTRKGSA